MKIQQNDLKVASFFELLIKFHDVQQSELFHNAWLHNIAHFSETSAFL